jgi:hypothetical protein
MITKNIIEELTSYQYKTYHGVKNSDIEKANLLAKLIEKREKTPTPGDIIICKGPAKIYINGHLEKKPEEHSSICVQPYIPFVFSNCVNEEWSIIFSTSGGYWLSVSEHEELKYVGKKRKPFKTWGHCGPCSDGAFVFPAIVNIWELYSENIY